MLHYSHEMKELRWEEEHSNKASQLLWWVQSKIMQVTLVGACHVVDEQLTKIAEDQKSCVHRKTPNFKPCMLLKDYFLDFFFLNAFDHLCPLSGMDQWLIIQGKKKTKHFYLCPYSLRDFRYNLLSTKNPLVPASELFCIKLSMIFLFP